MKTFRQRWFHPALEALPPRDLPAVALTAGLLAITGTEKPDTVSVIRDFKGTAVEFDDQIVVTVETPGRPKQVHPFALYEFAGVWVTRVGQINFQARGGEDFYFGYSGIPTVAYGGDGHDYFLGGPGLDTFYGQAGPDLLNSGGGPDTLKGGRGADTLNGGPGADSLFGGPGADLLNGDNQVEGPDTQNGDADFLYGGAGFNTLNGQGGDDHLYGGNDGNDLFGGAGTDYVRGGAAADLLMGGTGHDQLFGLGGIDDLHGNVPGVPADGVPDDLDGGAGQDFFHFVAAEGDTALN